MSLASPVHKVEVFPEELLQPSYFKAIKAGSFVLSIVTVGYIAIALSPWYLLPLGWLIAGTAITGLITVANDCENHKFVKSKLLNDIVGMLCLVPLWIPYNSLSQSAQNGTWLNRGPLWILRSLWQWMRSNFALPLAVLLGGSKLGRKSAIVNLICLYGFVCAFIPVMTMTLGIWGLFKFYVIPMLICHFWLSTCLKLSNEIEIDGETIVLCSYPSLIEFVGNNFNQIVTSLQDTGVPQIPSYNLKELRQQIKADIDYSLRTISLSEILFPHREERILMKVHGKNYDFTTFEHPGGPIALSLGQGRDATALFEAHHPFTSKKKMEMILKKYAVDEEITLLSTREQEEDNDVFDWPKEDAFRDELVRDVKEYFQGEADRRGISLLEATKATPGRWAEMIGFSALFLGTMPFFVQGYWFSIFLIPLAAWLSGTAIVHDAMHFSVSTDWRINALLGNCAPWTLSPLMWYHQHVIGHHAYPNVPFRDPDLAHAPAFVRLHDSIRWKPAHKFQLFAVSVVWTLGAALYMLMVPIKALISGVLNRSVILRRVSSLRVARHLLGRVFAVVTLWGWQWYVFQGDLPRQILFTFVPILLHSLCFMVSTQMNHLTPENIERSSRNYFVHQVVTSHSFSMGSKLVFWFTGGLNLQIEHHLFPTVNHCHLKAISPIVTRLCKKYDIYYHESASVAEAVGKHFSHVIAMSKKKIE